jgi:hypothetical protein
MSTQRMSKMIMVMSCTLLLAGVGCMSSGGNDVSGESAALKGGIPAKGAKHAKPDAGAKDDGDENTDETAMAGTGGDTDESVDEADEANKADGSVDEDTDEDTASDEAADTDTDTDEGTAGETADGGARAGKGAGHGKK